MENMVYEQTPPERRKNKHNIIYTLLIIVLISTWGYIIYDKSKTSVKIEQLQTQYVTVDGSRDQIQQLYNASLARLDSLIGVNQQIGDSLSNQSGLTIEKNEEIAKLKHDIRSILNKSQATTKELTSAKQKIGQLNTKINYYVAELRILKKENQKLLAQNQQMATAKDAVEKNLHESQVKLQSTVDIGSTLHAADIVVMPIHEKSSGKEKETSTAKRVTKFRISFNIDENRIASSGEKELYVCLYDPNNHPITIQAYGSGSFFTREEGKKLYTSKISIDYVKGKRSSVSFDWKQDQAFEAGDYKVEVYHNGFKIGEGVTTLKKGGLFS